MCTINGMTFRAPPYGHKGICLQVYIFVPARARDFLYSNTPSSHLGRTQHPDPLVSLTFSVGVKRPGREAEHSPPLGAKNERNSTSSSHVQLHDVHRDYLYGCVYIHT